MNKRWQDLSLLLVGCGSIGKRHARVLTSLGVKNLSAYDSDEKQLRSLLAESPNVKPVESYTAGLAQQPDAVFILTPPRLHIPQAMDALQAGCHVFLEKPLSDTLDGVEQLTALAQQSGKKVMVGLCFRYHEGLAQAKKLLDAGQVGRLVSVRALFGEHMPDVRPDYRNLFSAKYSGAFDCMHDIDLAIWYADQPITAVNALYGTYSDIGIEAPDVAEILVGFEDRCLASIHLDFFQRPRRRQMELIGTGGVIIVEFASWDKYTLSVYQASTGTWETRTDSTERDAMFRAEDMEFLKAAAEDKPIVSTIEEAARSMSVVLKAQKQP